LTISKPKIKFILNNFKIKIVKEMLNKGMEAWWHGSGEAGKQG
jgi:hypothetical protein